MPEDGCTWLRDHPEAFGEDRRPAHLETCETCRAQAEGLERLLRHGLRAKEVPVPPELAARIDRAVVARYAPRRVPSRRWLLAAAALILSIVAVVVLRWPKPDDSTANHPTPTDHRRAREIPTVHPRPPSTGGSPGPVAPP
jgi:hypothetical protein